jgi:hypothetical protein
MIKPLIVLCCCVILHLNSQGQNSIGHQFRNFPIKEQEPIFSGAEYRFFPPTAGGIIYFKSDTLTHGDVTYFNRYYKNIPLIYDQLTDELATVNIDGSALIRLFSPKVMSFRVYGSSFIFIPDSAGAITGKFWEVIFDSGVKVFKKEIKTIEVKVVDHKMARVVRTQIKYKMLLLNTDYDVSDKDKLLEALSDKKTAIRAFMKKNRRRFRKNGFETMIRETTNYYKEIAGPK